MMNINRYSLLQWFALLACGIWVGMLVLLGAAVAPSIFKFIDSKTQAGLLNGIILFKLNIMEWICGVILLTTSAFFLIHRKTLLHFLRVVASLLLLINLGYYSLIITPRMGELKQTIQNFDVPKDQDPRPERKEFDRFHKVYSSIVTVNVVLLLALSFLIANTAKQYEE